MMIFIGSCSRGGGVAFSTFTNIQQSAAIRRRRNAARVMVYDSITAAASITITGIAAIIKCRRKIAAPGRDMIKFINCDCRYRYSASHAVYLAIIDDGTVSATMAEPLHMPIFAVTAGRILILRYAIAGTGRVI